MGDSDDPVTAEPYVARGHGRERTFQENLTEPAEVRARIEELARELADELAGEGRPVVRVVVKVRFAPFFTSTHGAAVPEPSADAGAITAAAIRALEMFELDRPVRLLGVRAEFAR